MQVTPLLIELLKSNVSAGFAGVFVRWPYLWDIEDMPMQSF